MISRQKYFGFVLFDFYFRLYRKFIKAKEYRYKIPFALHSLKALRVGGEKCTDSQECGSGYCSFMRYIMCIFVCLYIYEHVYKFIYIYCTDSQECGSGYCSFMRYSGKRCIYVHIGIYTAQIVRAFHGYFAFISWS